MGRKMQPLTNVQGLTWSIRLDAPECAVETRTKKGLSISEQANRIVNWIQAGTSPAERAEFYEICRDHQNDRRTTIRMYFTAGDFIRRTAKELHIPKKTVLHCAFEFAKRSGWYEIEE